MVFCSKCGSENKDTNNTCEKCGEFLLKDEFFEAKKEEKFEDIFTEKNFNALNEITIEGYHTVIINIINQGITNLNNYIRMNNINFDNLSILNKIGIITSAYVNIHSKSIGSTLGFYSYNRVQIDDRMYDSQQIATFIHELSHHIFSEILEQLLMYVWECGKSDAIEAFAWFTLIRSKENSLANEFCAHTCEGRFIPYGYQNYGSYSQILNNYFDQEREQDIIQHYTFFGNTIAKDIIFILEKFIGPNLREEIKEQFKKDNLTVMINNQILNENEKVFPEEDTINIIIKILSEGFQEAKNKDMYATLENYKHEFADANTTYNSLH